MKLAILKLILRLCRPAGPNGSNWAFMRIFEIPSFDEPQVNYLTRGRLIQTPLFGIYLHKFDRPDSRPTLHDHPWRFLSIVLAGGGYTERRGFTFDRVEVTGLNCKGATDLHYIEELHSSEVWTLMLVGRRRRTWGYVERADTRLNRPLTEARTWTAFDKHPYVMEFDNALNERRIAKRRKS